MARNYNDVLNATLVQIEQPGLEPTIYRTRGDHASHYATDAVLFLIVIDPIIYRVSYTKRDLCI
jgi:hypothetical protein